MKQIILSIAFTLILSMPDIFANNERADDSLVQVTFGKEFPRAEHVKWSRNGDYMKASFILDDIGVVAFFSQDGELVGSARNVLYSQLPLVVVTSFEKRFTKANISGIGITEITNAGRSRYMFPLELNGKKYSATFYQDGTLSTIKKLKK